MAYFLISPNGICAKELQDPAYINRVHDIVAPLLTAAMQEAVAAFENPFFRPLYITISPARHT